MQPDVRGSLPRTSISTGAARPPAATGATALCAWKSAEATAAVASEAPAAATTTKPATAASPALTAV